MASFEGHQRYSVAVDTPAGLLVPVIRDVDSKNLWELAEETAELAAKARERKLKPAEMQGACFTISSLGAIGGQGFTPIVNAPEVAILGVSRLAVKPVWASNKVLRTKFTNVTIKDGYVYGLSDGILECIELATGERMWRSARLPRSRGCWTRGSSPRSWRLLLKREPSISRFIR